MIMIKGNTETAATLKYKCHTPRKLMMQRIFLTEKKEEESRSGQSTQIQMFADTKSC